MRFDLIIVGGGLVGAGLANALRDSRLRIALIDARVPASDDPRLFALNVSSCQFLANLGIWERLAPHAAPIQQVHVSHQGHFGSVRLNARDAHLPFLGQVIPACHIEAALNDALAALSNLTLYRPARLQSLKQTADAAELAISTELGEQVLSAPLVIGADGTESTVRAALNIPVEIEDYHQCAIVTRTHLSRPGQSVAYERFYQQGAIAMLPLPEKTCATIWTADTPVAQELMSLSDEAFVSALQKTFGYRLGRLRQTEKRHLFPLRMTRARQGVEGKVFLLGNSLHTLHPIAAQGFNLALYETAVLAEGMLARLSQGQPVTAADLQTLSSQIERQQRVSIGVSDGLAKIFSRQAMWSNWLLSLGMTGFDALPSVKKQFIGMMTGRMGRVPSLLMSNQEA